MFVFCPTCRPRQLIGKVEQEIESISCVCPHCHLQYKVTVGKLWHLVFQRSRTRTGNSYNRYQLRILLSTGQVVCFKFQLLEEYDRLDLHKADCLAVFECRSRDNYHAVLAVENYSTSHLHQIVSLSERSFCLSFSIGTLAALLVTAALTALYPARSINQLLLASLPVGVVAGTVVYRRTTPKITLSKSRLSEIKSTCQLLAEMNKVDEKLKLVKQKKQRQLALIRQMESLKMKINSSPLDYSNQLSTVQRALSIVRSRLQSTETALEEYQQINKMLESQRLAIRVDENLSSEYKFDIENNVHRIEAIELKTVFSQIN